MANEYRLQSNGEIKTKEELIAANANTSFPKVWNDEVCEFLGVDVVFETPQPTPSGDYKTVVRNGVEQNDNDQWVQAWVEQDMFADTTVDGVTTTKAEHETAYQAALDADVAKSVRSQRDGLLVETDWMGLSDVTMSSDWATYRQALRDVPSQSGFPHDITWPEKPE
jgi:hypothetical protein